MSVFVVPDPADFHADDSSGPVFGMKSSVCSCFILITHNISVKLHKPHMRVELEDTSCFAIDWANSEQIAVGCTNGQSL